MKTLLKSVVKATGLKREHVAALRMYGERQLLASQARGSRRPGGRILCYHSVGQPALGVNDVTPGLFRRQIELALDAGYRFVPALDIARTGGGPKDLAITFDDALTSLRTNAAAILRNYRIPWAVFAVSGWSEHGHPWGPGVAMGWDDLAALVADGVHVGSHSASHADFGKICAAEMEDELAGSRAMFERRLGFAPSTFAIPLGQSRNWQAIATPLARKAGYDVVYAQAEETRPEGTVARTFVTRFDNERVFAALLGGAFDRWEEWVW